MAEQTRVLLYEISGLALIVPSSAGVVYQNQTRGHACLPSRQEGYLVPLAGDVPDKCHQLHKHFTGPKWGGWCSDGIDKETADFIDEVLHHMPGRDEIAVDRTQLGGSWESWIHVRISGKLLSLVEHAAPVEAILTWPNSD